MVTNERHNMQATEDRTYNGWTNYETWAVGMYLDGNYTGEGTYREVLEIAERRNGEEDNATRTRVLAEDLKDYVEQDVFGDEAPASIATDLLGKALGDVNWRELAEVKLAEIAENDGPTVTNSQGPNSAD